MSITLNENQLETLNSFIIKRGIREKDVVNEILDHFACKTEEIMSAKTTVSFEDAMAEAHRSFGKSGFRPVVAQYEKHLKKSAWIHYKASFLAVLKSPAILFAASGGILFYTIINLLSNALKTHWLFGVPQWALLFSILSFLLVKYFDYSKGKQEFGVNIFKNSRMELWHQKSLRASINGNIILNCSLVTLPFTEKEPSTFLMIYCSVIVMLSIISSLAQYKTFTKMENQFGQKALAV